MRRPAPGKTASARWAASVLSKTAVRVLPFFRLSPFRRTAQAPRGSRSTCPANEAPGIPLTKRLAPNGSCVHSSVLLNVRLPGRFRSSSSGRRGPTASSARLKSGAELLLRHPESLRGIAQTKPYIVRPTGMSSHCHSERERRIRGKGGAKPFATRSLEGLPPHRSFALAQDDGPRFSRGNRVGFAGLGGLTRL